MPTHGPGARRNDAVATKTTRHGDLAAESGFVGVAFKTQAINPYTNPTSAAAREIASGETFVQMLGGMVEVRGGQITGGIAAAPVGTLLYIDPATNTVHPGSAAGRLPVGRVDRVDSARSVVRVNLNERFAAA